jgi:RNA polymerase sigma factor (sigma-70 family)
VANLTVFLQRLTKGLAAKALSGLPDRELLERFVARNEEKAFEAIVRRHGPMVLRVCWRVLRQTQDAEDAFQATFLLLAHNARSVRKPDSLASWLHGVARRIALKARTQRAVRRRHEELHAATAGLRTDAGAEQVRCVLDDELACLPAEWRLPLILCYLEGRTQDEAAAQLGWSTRTFRRRLEVARDELGRLLVRRGLALSAALSVLLLSDSAVSAAVPASLAASTVEAGTRVVASGSTAGVVSADVLALTEGVRTAMFASRLKVIAALALLVGAVAAGIWGIGGQAAQPPGSVPGNKPNPPGKEAGGKVSGERKDGPTVVKADEIVKDGKLVLDLAYCNGGKTVAVVVWKGHPSRNPNAQETAVVLWDVQQGKVGKTLVGFDDGRLRFHHVTASKDGTMIAASAEEIDGKVGDVALKVWDAKTGKLVQTITTDRANHYAAFSPDGKKVACAGHIGKVFVLEVQTGILLDTLEAAGPYQFFTVAFSPDGKLIAAGGGLLGADNTVETKAVVWEVQTGKVRHELADKTMTGNTGSLAFSPDGKSLATGSPNDATVRVWDVVTGKVKHRLNAHAVGGLTFSPDGGALAAGGEDDPTVLVWDVAKEKPRATLEGHGKHEYGEFRFVCAVGFAPDGRTVASGGWDGTMRFWRLDPAPGKK